MAGDADDIAHVQGAKQPVDFFAYAILLDINLQTPAAILQMKKRGFAHAPQRHDPSRDVQILRRAGQLFIAGAGKCIDNFRSGVCRFEIVRIHAEPAALSLASFCLRTSTCSTEVSLGLESCSAILLSRSYKALRSCL